MLKHSSERSLAIKMYNGVMGLEDKSPCGLVMLI